MTSASDYARRTAILLCLIAFLLAAWSLLAFGQTAEKTYRVNRTCETSPELRITQIRVTKDATIVTLVCRAENDTWITTAPPRHKEAFFIVDPRNRTQYHLLNVRGIGIMPRRTQLRKGGSCTVELTFERISDSMRSLHLIEGEQEPAPAPATGVAPISWRFMNVKFR